MQLLLKVTAYLILTECEEGTGWLRWCGHTCSPENRVIEEGELHLSVMLQGGPAPGGCHIDVGHIQRHMHRQE
jgi:hypothetical protein